MPLTDAMLGHMFSGAARRPQLTQREGGWRAARRQGMPWPCAPHMNQWEERASEWWYLFSKQ